MVFDAVDALGGRRSLVCIRREAVSTNCPTLALKPERKALNGWRERWVSVCGGEKKEGRAGQAYIIPGNNTINELHHPDEDEKRHEDVEEQCACGCVVEVLIPDMGGDLLEGGAGR